MSPKISKYFPYPTSLHQPDTGVSLSISLSLSGPACLSAHAGCYVVDNRENRRTGPNFFLKWDASN